MTTRNYDSKHQPGGNNARYEGRIAGSEEEAVYVAKVQKSHKRMVRSEKHAEEVVAAERARIRMPHFSIQDKPI